MIPGEIGNLASNDTFKGTILPSMISAATKIAEKQGAKEISTGLKRMNLKLDHEISRLNQLQIKNKDIRPEEIQIAIAEQATLAALIKYARIRLDSLLLIRKD
jgi:ATP-dependent helicase HepA